MLPNGHMGPSPATLRQCARTPTARLPVSRSTAGSDTDAAVEALTPLLSVAPVLDQQAQLAPYPAIVAPLDATHYGGQADPLISNGLAVHLAPELNETIAAGLRSGVAPWIAIRAVGGAVNDVDPGATAYAHRHQNFNVSSVGGDAGRFHAHWDVFDQNFPITPPRSAAAGSRPSEPHH